MTTSISYPRLEEAISPFLNTDQMSVLTRHLIKVSNSIILFEGAGHADDDVAARLVFSRDKLASVAVDLREELSYAANGGKIANASAMLEKVEELCSDGLTQFEKAFLKEYEGMTEQGRVATMRRAVRLAKMALKELGADHHIIVVLD